MECQHDSAAHIFHCDPADLLIQVAALIDLTAVIRSQEVGTGNGCRQIGIDLNQVIGTVAVPEAERIFLRLSYLRLSYLRLGHFRLGHLRFFRLRGFHSPLAAVKGKGVVGI